MHRTKFSILFLLIIFTGCAASTTPTKELAQPADTMKQTKLSAEKQTLGPDNWPTTVDATVKDIISSLSDKDKETVRNTKKDDLILFHHGWGTGIRNHYGLWRGNDQLREDACGNRCHPDDASMVIIEKVWEALQNEG
ncbi:MAG: DUF6794 domain-containing protein [Thermodesulfobacteriota bacterium]